MRNEAEHLRYRAVVRLRGREAPGQREECAEHRQHEDHRRPAPEAGRRERNLEADQRGLVADPVADLAEDQIGRVRHLASGVRRRPSRLRTALEVSF